MEIVCSFVCFDVFFKIIICWLGVVFFCFGFFCGLFVCFCLFGFFTRLELKYREVKHSVMHIFSVSFYLLHFCLLRNTVFKRKKKKASAINSTYISRLLEETCCIEEVSAENWNSLRSKLSLLED